MFPYDLVISLSLPAHMPRKRNDAFFPTLSTVGLCLEMLSIPQPRNLRELHPLYKSWTSHHRFCLRKEFNTTACNFSTKKKKINTANTLWFLPTNRRELEPHSLFHHISQKGAYSYFSKPRNNKLSESNKLAC